VQFFFEQRNCQREIAAVDPNSTTVPPAIINGLGADGVDVSSFHPSRPKNSDIAGSARLITIGIELPRDARNQAKNEARGMK